MDWAPISEASLRLMLNEAEERMSPHQARLWAAIRIPVQKWTEKSYGEAGNGFWVVAVLGATVVWYNDIEDGFSRSRYDTVGEIGEYWCNQDELEHTLQGVLNAIEVGYDTTPKLAPPVRLVREPEV